MIKFLTPIILLAFIGCSKYSKDYKTADIDATIEIHNRISNDIDLILSLTNKKGEELHIDSSESLFILVNDEKKRLEQALGLSIAFASNITLKDFDQNINEIEVHFSRAGNKKNTSIKVAIPKKIYLEQPQSYEVVMSADNINILATTEPNSNNKITKQAYCLAQEYSIDTLSDILMREEGVKIVQLPVEYSISEFLNFEFSATIDSENTDESVNLLLKDGQNVKNVSKNQISLIEGALNNGKPVYDTRQLYESITCSASIIFESNNIELSETSLFNTVQINSKSASFNQFLIEL